MSLVMRILSLSLDLLSLSIFTLSRCLFSRTQGNPKISRWGSFTFSPSTAGPFQESKMRQREREVFPSRRRFPVGLWGILAGMAILLLIVIFSRKRRNKSEPLISQVMLIIVMRLLHSVIWSLQLSLFIFKKGGLVHEAPTLAGSGKEKKTQNWFWRQMNQDSESSDDGEFKTAIVAAAFVVASTEEEQKKNHKRTPPSADDSTMITPLKKVKEDQNKPSQDEEKRGFLEREA